MRTTKANVVKELAKRRWVLVAAGAVALALGLADWGRGAKIIDVTLYSLKEMLLFLPPIFVILGLLAILLGARSTTKIPILMSEPANLGARFMLTRLIIDLVGIVLMALLLERLLPEKGRQQLNAKAQASQS